MEFWGVEVQAGKPLTVQPDLGKLIHISQASLGEVKKDAAKGPKTVLLRMKIDGKDFIIGTLATEDRPQLMFDLVFEKEFELSHDLKTGSVYFIGYSADEPVSDVEGGFSSDDSEDESEDELVENKENGGVKAKPVEKAAPAAPNGAAKASKGAAAAKVVAKKEEPSDSDDDEDDSDEEMALDGSLGGDSSDDLSEKDSDDDDDSEEEEQLTKQPLKKRPAQAPAPVPAKKAKAFTPTDNKQGNNKKGQNASPNPSKPFGKTPPGGNKSKQSPNPGSGNKNFNNKNSKGKGKQRGGK